jgi:hypothetical protein
MTQVPTTYDVYDPAGRLIGHLDAAGVFAIYLLAPDELAWAIEEHGVATVEDVSIVESGDTP